MRRAEQSDRCRSTGRDKKEFIDVISFEHLALVEPIRRALKDEGYAVPTPIQAQAIPQLLAGRDLLGIAQTGTGKTAAFALPILQRLAASRGQAGLQRKTARCLVLTPTRELALQIGDSFRAYGRHLGLRSLVIFGGVGQNPQVAGMARGVDILTATPGRLLDLIGQGHLRLDAIETVVLDEADRMLDMGFIHDVKKIVALLPKQRQTLLFSATMPTAIARLAAGILRDPVRVEVTPPSTTVELIEQRVAFVERAGKREMLCAMLRDAALARVLVFTRTRHTANRVAEQLTRADFLPRRFTAISRRVPGSARSKDFAPAMSACWSRLTSRRAASMWMASLMSSITSCRTYPIPMSTALAAPREPGRRARRSRCATARSAPTLRTSSGRSDARCRCWTHRRSAALGRSAAPHRAGAAGEARGERWGCGATRSFRAPVRGGRLWG